ncbi:hypothetical protein CRG98_049531, partial [Punica granatum]
EIVGSLSSTEDRWPEKTQGLVTGTFSVFPECLEVFGDRYDLSEIVVISVFRGNVPKAHRETY